MKLLATGIALCVAFITAGCATVRLDVPRTHSEAWPHPEQTALGQKLAGQLATADGQSGVYLLTSGMEAFSLRGALAESAERTLDLQYYIVHEDTTSQLLLYRVLRAANRGVRVRFLIDDTTAIGKDFDLATFSAHPNIEVRVFNAFAHRGPLGLGHALEFLGDSTRLNRRMHNKLWVADNAAAIVGGRNLGDEYFDAHSEINFSDLDLFVTGPVVREVSQSFDDYWNSEWAVPIEAFVAAPPGPDELKTFEQSLVVRLERFRETPYAAALRDARPAQRLRSGLLPLVAARATALYDDPADIARDAAVPARARPLLSANVRPLMEAAKRELVLISPYFIPGPKSAAMLAALARRGVRVRILTNSLASTDAPVVHAGYAKVRGPLVAAGVELYEMRPTASGTTGSSLTGASSGASLHAKAIIIDRQHVLVGSMNFDPRSRRHNTEVAVLLQSADIGESLAAFFDEAVRPAKVFQVKPAASGQEALVWITEEAGKETRYSRDPMASAWRRLLVPLLGALTPADLL